MRIRDMMTANPACCLADDSAVQAARIMVDKKVGVVPVVESSSRLRLLGVVTDRDLCVTIVVADREPSAVKVRECMTANIVACRPDDDVQRAVDLMSEHQVRRIPVIDQEGLLQGMVSMANVWQRSDVPPQTTHQTLKNVTEPTAHASKPRAKTSKAA